MVIGMFEESKISVPHDINYYDIFDAAVAYVIPKVRSAIPGVIDSIKELKSRGFSLFTAAGAVSNEMKLYLEGMGILQLFKGIYGPDVINNWKAGPEFYRKIFQHSGVDAAKAIVIEDNPKFLKSALEVEANVIQACITGEYAPQFPFFVEDMGELPVVIDNLILSQK
jgi:HAD superfamily hydrolase (TIGR01509 family)